MTARLRSITLLLRSLDWFEPQPETSTGNIVRRGSKPGEGPSHRAPCRECGGDKYKRVRGIPMPCNWCADPATGEPRGWEELDDYTGRRIGDVRTHLETGAKTVICDSCGGKGVHANEQRCTAPGCNGSGVIELTESQWRSVRSRIALSADVDWGAAGDPVCAAIDKRDATGSYWELGLALGALRLELPRAYRTLVRVYVEASLEPEHLDEDGHWRVEIALRYLERLMPSEILVPAGVMIAERNRKARARIKQRLRGESAA